MVWYSKLLMETEIGTVTVFFSVSEAATNFGLAVIHDFANLTSF
jgi:hypothetical protein